GQVLVTVADNGHGFAFHGHYDHSALTSLQLGPVLLKQRVESLGGALEIDSTKDGAHLEIALPYRSVDALHDSPPRARRRPSHPARRARKPVSPGARFPSRGPLYQRRGDAGRGASAPPRHPDPRSAHAPGRRARDSADAAPREAPDQGGAARSCG